MATSTTYTVTGPAVVVTDEVGKVRYYYQGAVLPSDLPARELERLTDAGLLSTNDVVLVAVDPATVAVGPSTSVSSSPALDPADAPTVKSRK